MILFAIALYVVPDRKPRQSALISWSALAGIVKNKPFMRLIAAWFLNGLANGIPAALFFMYLQYALGADEEARSVFVLIYFASGVLSIPLWTRLSRQIGKNRAWCLAMLAAVMSFAVVPWLHEGAFIAFGLICVVTGMALGADLALPPSIQADVVDYDRWRFHRRRAGLQFALWGMATKFALALGIGIALPSLEALGFDPEAPDAHGVFALAVIYAWVPAGIKLSAIALMWRFPLSRQRHRAIQKRLSARIE